MTIDPTPLSAVTALKSNLQSQLSNAAQASGQASERRSVDEVSERAKQAWELNTAAGSNDDRRDGSSDPFRGKRIDTLA